MVQVEIYLVDECGLVTDDHNKSTYTIYQSVKNVNFVYINTCIIKL